MMKLILFLILVSFSSYASLSEEINDSLQAPKEGCRTISEHESSLACSDFFKYLCEPDTEQERKKYYNDLILADLKVEFGEQYPEIKELDDMNKVYNYFFNLKEYKMGDLHDFISRKEQELAQNTLNKINSVEGKNHLNGILTDVILSNSQLSIEQKNNHLKEISSFKIASAYEIPEDLTPVEIGLVESYIFLACGPDKKEYNAIALNLESTKLVLICPSMLKELTRQDRTPKQVVNDLSYVIAHEVGHFFHFNNKEDYKDYEKCLQRSPRRKQLGQEFNFFQKFVNIFRRPSIEQYMNEIAADYWGHQVVGSMLSKVPDQVHYLKNNYYFLCQGYKRSQQLDVHEHDVEHLHPPQKFRTNVLAIETQSIQETLKCKKRKKQCDL